MNDLYYWELYFKNLKIGWYMILQTKRQIKVLSLIHCPVCIPMTKKCYQPSATYFLKNRKSVKHSAKLIFQSSLSSIPIFSPSN